MTRTYRQMALQLGVVVCFGVQVANAGWVGVAVKCPLDGHDRGFVDPFGLLHWRERRVTKRGAKRFLMLLAKQERLRDEGYLNVPARYDWLYQHVDSVAAQRMAGELGFRLPARLFDMERERCKLLARKAGVKLSQHTALYAWLQR